MQKVHRVHTCAYKTERTRLLGRCARQRLMQGRREPVPQLARVRGQIERHLLELFDHHPPRPLVAAKLPVHELFPLPHAADNCPEQQVRHVDGDGLREAREFGRVRADGARVAGRIEGEDLQAADLLP